MTTPKHLYSHFFGIDISKNTFEVAMTGSKETQEYANTLASCRKFVKQHRDVLKKSLVVLEATGGYEMQLILVLMDQKITVHRANPRKVKYFIRSLGIQGKTDQLDAHCLKQYACERHLQLTPFALPEPSVETLGKLVKRRNELVAIQTQEKNRLKGPDRDLLQESVRDMLTSLRAAIIKIEEQIKELVQNHWTLLEKHKTLKQISGVGDKVAWTLLAFMPELGTVTGKQIASLAGVAPHPKQSGTYQGYRRTCGGREKLKPSLFLAAMTAARGKSDLGNFYKILIKNGKKPIVANVALMRKIVVIANAKIRDLNRDSSLTT